MILLLAACGGTATDAPVSDAGTDSMTSEVSAAETVVDGSKGEIVTAEMIKALLNEREIVLGWATGDLNGDGYQDAVVVADWDEDYRNTHILLQDAGGLRIHQSNAFVALCAACGGAMGDPFVKVEIGGSGDFWLDHYGGSRERWTRVMTFRHAGDNRFELNEDVYGTMDSLDPDNEETVVLTTKDFGKIDFESYNWEDSKFF